MKERFDRVWDQIHGAEQQAGRPQGSVRLIAVTKTQPSSVIRDAYALGLRHFGENYLQEAISKQQELSDLPDLVWHFIGPIQSNKTRLIAEHFDWVHTVDRERVASRLNEQRPTHLPALNVCIQVNVSDEISKSGVRLDDLPQLVSAFEIFSNLKLRGLMAIPAPLEAGDQDPGAAFRKLREASALLHLDSPRLSMGMSNDLDWAVREGATDVRIGTALFGQRSPIR